MKISLLAAGLSALLYSSTATADDIPDNYAVSKFTSSSTYKEVDGFPVQADNGTFRLGGSATILCDPEEGDDCDSTDVTALYNYTSLVGYSYHLSDRNHDH